MLMEIKTVQAATLKQLVDALKEILMDVNLEFDETGMKIVALDNTHVVLVHMKLEAERFESYFCERKLFVGINIIKFHMLIKTVTTKDILTLFVERNDPNRMGLRIENLEKKTRTTFKLAMLDINPVSISIPPPAAMTMITMPSIEFQKIIRDMHNLADFLEICCVGNDLSFSCKGDSCTQETHIGLDQNDNMAIVRDEARQNEIIQGVYSLKYLTMFTKCTNLNKTVQLYLKNNFPLIMQYNISSLGSIKLVLAEQDNTAE